MKFAYYVWCGVSAGSFIWAFLLFLFAETNWPSTAADRLHRLALAAFAAALASSLLAIAHKELK